MNTEKQTTQDSQPITPVNGGERTKNKIGWRVLEDCTLEYTNYEAGEEILIPCCEDCPNDWPGIDFYDSHYSIFQPINDSRNDLPNKYQSLKEENERLKEALKDLVKWYAVKGQYIQSDSLKSIAYNATDILSKIK